MIRFDLLRFFTPIAGGLEAVEAELERLLRSEIPVVERLASHIRGGKGKRLRPALLLMAGRLCGAPQEAAVRFGAVFELTHTATLIHDDVIDHAGTRRAKPTLNVLWGNTLSVLFGDLLYLQAMSSAIQGRSWRVMEILCDVTTRMIEGELIQNSTLHRLDTRREDYFEIQERKTALLFSGCTETAAVLAGRDPETCEALRRYGLEIGRAFQLVDDLLDYTATTDQLGKPAFSDLREGKLTLPMLTLLERAPGEAQPLVEALWALPEGAPTPTGIETALRSLITRLDALDETRALAQRASRAAAQAIAQVDGESRAKGLLAEIPELLLARSN